MFGIFVTTKGDRAVVTEMDKATREWEMRAARGECAWVCSDCGTSFPDGMPAACANGVQSCTDLINRNKSLANEKSPD